MPLPKYHFFNKCLLIVSLLLSLSSSFGENRCVDLFLPSNVVLFPRAFKPPVIFKEAQWIREIFAAMEENDFGRAQQMLKTNHFKFINSIHPQSGETLLHHATEYYNSDFVQFLLKNGADPNIKNTNGQTALHIATIDGHRVFVELLLANRADINSKDAQGNTPIVEALNTSVPSEGYVDVFLKHPDLDVNSVNVDGLSLVHLSLRLKLPFYALQLIKLGADVDSVDPDGRTPLHWSAIQDNAEMAEFLIKEGADLNAKDSQGLTAMNYARNEQNMDVMNVLSRVKKSKTDLLPK